MVTSAVGTVIKPNHTFPGQAKTSNAVNQRFVHIISPVIETALLESAEGETKVCGLTGYRTRDL